MLAVGSVVHCSLSNIAQAFKTIVSFFASGVWVGGGGVGSCWILM